MAEWLSRSFDPEWFVMMLLLLLLLTIMLLLLIELDMLTFDGFGDVSLLEFNLLIYDCWGMPFTIPICSIGLMSVDAKSFLLNPGVFAFTSLSNFSFVSLLL